MEEAHIRITLQGDEIIWASAPHGRYTPGEGYSALITAQDPVEVNWWWCLLWKLKAPHKAHLFMWCILSNKVPTKDNLKRRAFHGPSRCCLCKANVEDIDQLLLHSPVVCQVWIQITSSLNIMLRWDGAHLSDAWQNWWNVATTQKIRNLPLLICWGIWLTRNHTIF